MSKTLKQYSGSRLRQKQATYWLKHLEKKEEEMANDEQEVMDFDTAAVEGESKNERFKRVVNPRLKVAVTRLRLIRQMFEGSTASNYEFTNEQHSKLVAALREEVDAIDKLMSKRLRNRDDDITQL